MPGQNRTTFPAVVESQDKGFPGYFNGMANYLSSRIIRARLAAISAGADATYYGTTDKLVYDLFGDATTTAHVDTSNSTCLYTENGLVAFCDVLDLFDDASFSATIWSSSVGTGTTLTEASGYVEITANDTGNRVVSFISNGASGLDCHGQNTEVILDIAYLTTNSGGGGNSNISVQMSNGATHVTLWTKQGTSVVIQDDNIYLRIVYDHANTRCDVWEINKTTGAETLYASNTSVSTVTTNKYIRVLGETVQSGGNHGLSYARIYGLGYRKHGAGAANADFVNTAVTVDASSNNAIVHPVWTKAPSGTPTLVLSLDGSTTYSTGDGYDAWAYNANAGTSLKFRLRVAKPTTITADTQNIPVLGAWGALYG